MGDFYSIYSHGMLRASASPIRISLADPTSNAAEVAPYFAERGWRVLWDRDDAAVARHVGLPPQLAQAVERSGMHITLATLE